MCSVKPIYEFAISEERVAKALQTIKRVTDKDDPNRLTLETCIDICLELGWPDVVAYIPSEPDPDERLQLNMTDVQFCALAAALASVYEIQGRRRLAS